MEISNKIPPVEHTAYSRQGVSKVEQKPAPVAKGDSVQIGKTILEVR